MTLPGYSRVHGSGPGTAAPRLCTDATALTALTRVPLRSRLCTYVPAPAALPGCSRTHGILRLHRHALPAQVRRYCLPRRAMQIRHRAGALTARHRYAPRSCPPAAERVRPRRACPAGAEQRRHQKIRQKNFCKIVKFKLCSKQAPQRRLFTTCRPGRQRRL